MQNLHKSFHCTHSVFKTSLKACALLKKITPVVVGKHHTIYVKLWKFSIVFNLIKRIIYEC